MEKNRLLEKVTKNSEMQNQLATSVVTRQKRLRSPECYFLICYSSFPLLGLSHYFTQNDTAYYKRHPTVNIL